MRRSADVRRAPSVRPRVGGIQSPQHRGNRRSRRGDLHRNRDDQRRHRHRPHYFQQTVIDVKERLHGLPSASCRRIWMAGGDTCPAPADARSTWSIRPGARAAALPARRDLRIEADPARLPHPDRQQHAQPLQGIHAAVLRTGHQELARLHRMVHRKARRRAHRPKRGMAENARSLTNTKDRHRHNLFMLDSWLKNVNQINRKTLQAPLTSGTLAD
jgi:hypothetical protein